jgi:hypothetical protein
MFSFMWLLDDLVMMRRIIMKREREIKDES